MKRSGGTRSRSASPSRGDGQAKACPTTAVSGLHPRLIEALPGICSAAREIHGRAVEARTAALLAMTGLAGMVGWTGELVELVEREMEKA